MVIDNVVIAQVLYLALLLIVAFSASAIAYFN